MVMLKRKKIMMIAIAAIVLLSGIYGGKKISVMGISPAEACNRSEACMAAKAKEEESIRKAAEAAKVSTAYQNKVNELSMEIATKEAEIAESKASVAVLEAEITAKEKELKEEQEALAELLVDIHFESDAEPIVVLAGAESISDLAERAAREEVAEEQISAAATKVKETKASLENDKAEIEKMLAIQEQAKTELAQAQTEQQALVEKYANDAEKYEEDAEVARAERINAQAEYMKAHQSSYISSDTNAYAGAYNSYPWQNECPGGQDSHITYYDGHKIGGYVCECVSYAGWKAYETYGVAAAWGNAYSWDDGARNAGYVVNNTPAAGTIGQRDGGPYGHVFWVEGVNGDGSINVTEYNNYYSTGLYMGSYHVGDFGARVIPASEVWQYNYIHF